MILSLLMFSVFAQEPMAFDPMVVDHMDGSVLYSGILVDERTFTELGVLRVAVRTKDDEIRSFEEWQISESERLDQSLTSISETCRLGSESIVSECKRAIGIASKRTIMEEHGYPIGVAVGFVSATILATGTVYAMGQVYNISIVR